MPCWQSSWFKGHPVQKAWEPGGGEGFFPSTWFCLTNWSLSFLSHITYLILLSLNATLPELCYGIVYFSLGWIPHPGFSVSLFTDSIFSVWWLAEPYFNWAFLVQHAWLSTSPPSTLYTGLEDQVKVMFNYGLGKNSICLHRKLSENKIRGFTIAKELVRIDLVHLSPAYSSIISFCLTYCVCGLLPQAAGL